jgi:hypothetical protein
MLPAYDFGLILRFKIKRYPVRDAAGETKKWLIIEWLKRKILKFLYIQTEDVPATRAREAGPM